MESLHFGIKSGKKGAAHEHQAYITRKGRHAARGDLLYTGYGNMPEWAKNDPSLLWKASDRHERKNGSTYRAFTIALPNALARDELISLAKEHAYRLAGTRPFQFAVHMLPRSSLSGEPNPHVHIMICDRVPDGIVREPEQMFRRYNAKRPELGGCRKESGGMTPAELRSQVRAQREAAADATNAALERIGCDVRVDHRTFKERGVEKTPERHLGPARIRMMSEQHRKDYVRGRQCQP